MALTAWLTANPWSMIFLISSLNSRDGSANSFRSFPNLSDDLVADRRMSSPGFTRTEKESARNSFQYRW